MGRVALQTCAVLTVAMSVLGGCRREEVQKTGSMPAVPAPQTVQTGEELFKQYCSPCHPDGGNVSDPERTLHGSALRANRIIRPEDIVRVMRNPVSRMIRFDAATISDREARAIAEYVLTAFK